MHQVSELDSYTLSCNYGQNLWLNRNYGNVLYVQTFLSFVLILWANYEGEKKIKVSPISCGTTWVTKIHMISVFKEFSKAQTLIFSSNPVVSDINGNVPLISVGAGVGDIFLLLYHA